MTWGWQINHNIVHIFLNLKSTIRDGEQYETVRSGKENCFDEKQNNY